MFYHLFSFFFFNATATTEIYTLSLHDALPISRVSAVDRDAHEHGRFLTIRRWHDLPNVSAEAHIRISIEDRKSTRLNSSHGYISYAVFCLKKKKKIINKIMYLTDAIKE